jgi:hypothetical protein
MGARVAFARIKDSKIGEKKKISFLEMIGDEISNRHFKD